MSILAPIVTYGLIGLLEIGFQINNENYGKNVVHKGNDLCARSNKSTHESNSKALHPWFRRSLIFFYKHPIILYKI